MNLKTKLMLALALFLGIGTGYSQEKHTISGYVKDGSSGEELIGARIFVTELNSGTVTNLYGFYSITLPKGSYHFVYSMISMKTLDTLITLDKDVSLNVDMKSDEEVLQAHEVVGEREDGNVTSTEMSTVKMSIKEIRSVPVLFGETDPLKTISLMPGIQAAGEGNAGFYVRGGGPDQNLILLDEAPVYNASHLLGFFSVFNADAIKDMQLYKGGIPAQYGGRLSSVLDIKMNEGNVKKFSASGGLGIIASRLTIEAPLVKDKSSIIISGRRSYLDLFLNFSPDERLQDTKLYFYDLNAKVNYKFSNKDRLFLSGYFGRDVFAFGKDFGFDWGNKTATLRWNHLFSNKLFMNTSAIYSDYDYTFRINVNDGDFKLQSGINDVNLKADLEYFPNLKNDVRFGANAIYHTFNPGVFTSSSDGIDDVDFQDKYAWEYAAYISNDHKLTDRLSAHYGLRYSVFTVMGPGDVYTLSESGDEVIDTVTYSKGDVIKTYHGAEPRLSLNVRLTEESSLKTSYNRTRQNLHLLSTSSTSTPVDSWVPSGAIIKPQIADQIALGYFRNLKKNAYEGSVEVYYKTMQNQIDYKPGANVIFNPVVETELLFGEGWSYGVELFLKKKKGKFTGWIGYTLARTRRKVEGINGGDAYPSRYDRTHDISIVGIYKLNDKWEFASTWIFYTGNAVTFPVGKYEYDGKIVNYYSQRNGYRMPDYHRLDLSATLSGKKTKKFESSWNFSVYNAYARKNAYTINFRQSENNPEKTEAVKLSLFSIVPAVTWNFKF